MDQTKIKELDQFAAKIRIGVLEALKAAGGGHIGGSMSIVELLAVLYGAVMKVDPENPQWEERDKLVISKGHSGPALYAALAERCFFPRKWLNMLNDSDMEKATRLPSHCDSLLTPGVDMTTGSLGQGSSTALGLAYAMYLDEKAGQRTYLILGDGEIQEGQVWEAMMFAGANSIVNLITFVDCNKKQGDGFVADVLNTGDVTAKFHAFGFFTQRIDGHDVAAIYNAIENAKAQNKTAVIILDTIKGKGSFAETVEQNHTMPIEPEVADADIAKLRMLL